MPVPAAQNALNLKASPQRTWGWKLYLRKSSKKVAVVAIARKLTVSVWYALRGLLAPLPRIDASPQVKLTQLATATGVKTFRHLGYDSKAASIEEKSAG